MKNKIAIIGGAGFLGSRLSKRLKQNNVDFNIYDLSRDDNYENHFYMDVEDKKSLEQLEFCSSIINLAAVHRDDIQPISRYDDVNVTGAKNICDAARKHGIKKIIFTSSVAIYGFAPEDTDESGSANYFNDYGRTKFLAENVFKEWLNEDPINRTLVIVRPTVIFGEGNRGNVYNLLKQIASKKFVMIGDGKNFKSMAYVENVAAFLEFSLGLKPGLHIFNYIDKPDFDMNTLVKETRRILFNKHNVGLRLPAFVGMVIGYCADLVAKIIGKSLPISSIRVKKFMMTTKFKSSIEKTSFDPPFDMTESLTRTIEYEFLEDNSDKKTFISE